MRECVSDRKSSRLQHSACSLDDHGCQKCQCGRSKDNAPIELRGSSSHRVNSPPLMSAMGRLQTFDRSVSNGDTIGRRYFPVKVGFRFSMKAATPSR